METCQQCGAERLSWDGGMHKCRPGDGPSTAWERWCQAYLGVNWLDLLRVT